MSQAGGKWNPVEGLKETYAKQIAKGDVAIVQEKYYDALSQDMDWQYVYKEYAPYMRYSTGAKYFILEKAPIEEPKDLGAAVVYNDNGVNLVAMRLRGAELNRPWYLYILEEDGSLDPEVLDLAWLNWEDIVKFNPKPYEWGDKN